MASKYDQLDKAITDIADKLKVLAEEDAREQEEIDALKRRVAELEAQANRPQPEPVDNDRLERSIAALERVSATIPVRGDKPKPVPEEPKPPAEDGDGGDDDDGPSGFGPGTEVDL